MVSCKMTVKGDRRSFNFAWSNLSHETVTVGTDSYTHFAILLNKLKSCF